jgi:hypothetical protein
VLLLSGACDTQELLEVETPGKVPEESLDNPTLARTLTNSVITDFECSWDGYVGAAAIHSDQFIQSSGNLTMRLWANRGITADDANFAQGACQDWGYGLYTPLQTARYQAENVFTRLSNFTDAEVGGQGITTRGAYLATVRAFGAWTLIAFGEGFCEAAFDGGNLMTRTQILELAETRFTHVSASTSGSTPPPSRMPTQYLRAM